MALSHWARAADRAAYERAYETSLELWPVAFEWRFIDTSFGQTHVIDSGPPTGGPVVALHAAALSAVQWYPQAAHLADAHRLLAVDIMADVGLSTQTRPIRSRRDAAAWLTGVLDALELDRAVFLGSSFGGFHAANLAVHEPDRVSALVLLAPAATIMRFRPYMKASIRMGSLIPMPFTVKPGLRALMQGGLPDARIVRQMEIGNAGFRYDRHSIFPSELSEAELASITCPTLVLVGDGERIYPIEEATERARRSIPDSEVEIVPGVGHLMGMQEPELINERIGRFLAPTPVAV